MPAAPILRSTSRGVKPARSHGSRMRLDLARDEARDLVAQQFVLRRDVDVVVHHMRNTPNFGLSGIGAFRLALSASASTRRVSAGSITPSSHSRAVA